MSYQNPYSYYNNHMDDSEEESYDDEGIVILKNDVKAGQIIKKIEKEGEGNPPKIGSKIKLIYSSKIQEKMLEENIEIEFVLGRDSVLGCLEITVQSMKKGETCVMKSSHQYGYGEKGCPPLVPPKTIIDFDMTLLDITQTDPITNWFTTREDSSEKDKELILKLKNEGNDFLVKNEIENSVNCYHKCLHLFSFLPSEEFDTEVQNLKLAIVGNLMNAYLKLEVYSPIIRLGQQLDKKNGKIYFRMGKAFKEMDDYSTAKSYFNKALKESPEDKLILKELREVENKVSSKRSGINGMFL
eukprot:TRINITY_DN2917_c0_g1_i1.p1 TRINITY_DN2917_c0_g1~~TRINITY_DN2917_c0_g1_i1.p1  ORF type:complete len:299 (-),score=85.85 TRINITY_DN2917_c0_g1_i1:36-932(-)